jgi:long-chain fatty acid transport protein
MYATAAVPEDPVTALSSNPAGITRLDGLQLTFGFQTPVAKFHYRSPTGYDHSSSSTPIAPDFGLSTDRWDPWYFAIGAYGNLGLTTDFPADPAGAPMTSSRLMNKLGVLRLAPTVAYRFSDSLSIGAGLLPAYGWQEAERPVPVAFLPGGGAGTAAAEIEADGFGIAAQVGVLVGPWHGLNFALSYRTRGKLSLHGDVSVGGFKDRVDAVYELPQSIVASLAYEPRPRTTVAVQMRWTDWTALNHSKFNFHRLDVFDARISNHARSITTFGGGIEHVTERGMALRTSVFYEGRAAGSADLWPNLVDAGYTGFSVGLGYPVGRYQVDFYAGISLVQTTRVAQSDTGFPGTYDADNGYALGIQFTRVWGGVESGEGRK